MFKYLACIFLSVFIVGCSSAPKPIQIPKDNSETNFIQISDDTKVIKAEADNIAKADSSLKPNTDNIKYAATRIDNSAKNLQETLKLKESTINKLDKELQKATEESNRWFNKTVMGIILISGITVGVSIALFLLGHIRSVTTTVIAGSVLLSAIALTKLMAWALFIALGFCGIIVLLLLWHLFISDKANKEIVKTVEQNKDNIKDYNQFRMVADKTQTETTKKLVDKQQKRLGKK